MTMAARWTGDAPASDDNHGIALTPTDVRAFASDMGLDDCCDHCGWPVGPQAIRDSGWTYCDGICLHNDIERDARWRALTLANLTTGDQQ